MLNTEWSLRLEIGNSLWTKNTYLSRLWKVSQKPEKTDGLGKLTDNLSKKSTTILATSHPIPVCYRRHMLPLLGLSLCYLWHKSPLKGKFEFCRLTDTECVESPQFLMMSPALHPWQFNMMTEHFCEVWTKVFCQK